MARTDIEDDRRLRRDAEMARQAKAPGRRKRRPPGRSRARRRQAQPSPHRDRPCRPFARAGRKQQIHSRLARKIFTPEVINDIHIKSELGRYRMRGFSLFKKIPHWDDLTFLPGTLTRFVIEGYREKCETKTVIGPRAKRPMVLDIPVYVTGMSLRRACPTRPRSRSPAAPPWRVRPPARARAA